MSLNRSYAGLKGSGFFGGFDWTKIRYQIWKSCDFLPVDSQSDLILMGFTAYSLQNASPVGVI